MRIILTIATHNNWEIHQLDIKFAYLYEKLNNDKQIYMHASFDIQLQEVTNNKMLKLKIALYDLKQVDRCWYNILRTILSKIGFKQSKKNHAVFYRHHPNDEIMIIDIHVDDMKLVASSYKNLIEIKARISKKLEVVDSGPISWLLGIKITRDCSARIIALSQQAYLEQILTKYDFADVKPRAVPMKSTTQYSTLQEPTSFEEVEKMSEKSYRQVLRALQYATINMRPDIQYAVNQLAHYNINSGHTH